MIRSSVGPQVLAQPGGIAVAAAADELGGDRGRRIGLVGEDGRFIVGDNPVDRPLQAAAVSGDEDGVIPRLLDLGEGILDGADVRHELQILGREVAQKVAADAEEKRIARGQHDGPPLRLLQHFFHLGQVPADLDLASREIGEERQLPLAAEQDLGPADEIEDPAAEPFMPLDTGANDVNASHLVSSPLLHRRPVAEAAGRPAVIADQQQPRRRPGCQAADGCQGRGRHHGDQARIAGSHFERLAGRVGQL